MTDASRISKGMYWDRAWSLVSGCTHVSPGCDNCWSAKETHMRANNPNEKIRARNDGLTEKGCFNGQIRLNHEFLDLPLKVKKPTTWAIWNDLFHEDVPFEFIAKVWEVVFQCGPIHRFSNVHTFLVLTKRPQRMLEFANWYHQEKLMPINLSNVWLGVTAENQEMADERIPILLQTPAAVRFVSVEPMVGPVNMRWLAAFNGMATKPRPSITNELDGLRCLDWVICGGESGPGARPMHPVWARGLRDQCLAAGVPFFFKQHGEWQEGSALNTNAKHRVVLNTGASCVYPSEIYSGDEKGWQSYHPTVMSRVGKKNAGRLLDNQTWDEFPGGKLGG